MNAIAISDKGTVELGHKKRGCHIAGLSDIDNDMTDTGFLECPLKTVDSFWGHVAKPRPVSQADRQTRDVSFRSIAAMSVCLA